jgi:hypothetical protein
MEPMSFANWEALVTKDPEAAKQVLKLVAELYEKQEGQRITDAINADPNEVAKLRQARKDARAGRRTPLDEAMPDTST